MFTYWLQKSIFPLSPKHRHPASIWNFNVIHYEHFLYVYRNAFNVQYVVNVFRKRILTVWIKLAVWKKSEILCTCNVSQCLRWQLFYDVFLIQMFWANSSIRFGFSSFLCTDVSMATPMFLWQRMQKCIVVVFAVVLV